MTSPVSAVEAIEKVMEGVTPGPWQTVQTRTDIQRLTVAGPSEIVCGLDGICEPDRMNDRLFAEDAANMRYIAACSPDRMREVLALARQANGCKEENAEKDARIAAAENALDKIVERAAGGTVVPGQSWEMTEKRIRFLEQDIRDIANRARALLGGSENAGN